MRLKPQCMIHLMIVPLFQMDYMLDALLPEWAGWWILGAAGSELAMSPSNIIKQQLADPTKVVLYTRHKS